MFDALTRQRPYKMAWPVPATVAEILGQRGRQFHRCVVDALATLDHPALLKSASPSGGLAAVGRVGTVA